MRALRLLPAAAVLAVAAGVAPAPASAQGLAWQPCAPAGFECAQLPVPVDRAGSVPGTLPLNATRVVAANNPTRTAVLALAGGPGQSAVPIATGFARVLSPALATRDLLVFDQRGTGGSNPLRCGALNLAFAPTTVVAERCANQLGPARAFFRTAETVQDIESLRVAAGYEKLAIYGVSYGTKVALAYAAAHPDRVESLLLDSVVPPEGIDAFRRSSLSAVGRVLTELCTARRCAGITSNAARDLRALASRLRRKALRGSVFASTGRRFTARLTEPGLLGILLAGDLNPALRAELPGSMRAALTGDATPILRLSARSAGLQNRVGWQSSRADSDALFLATTCEENPTFPWTRGARTATKLRQASRALRRLPSRALGAFSRAAVYDQSVLSTCVGWPTASPAPVSPGPLPAVPTLILEGRADLRTPVEDGLAVAARIPAAQVVAVPDVGHSVTGADGTSCASDAIAAFYGGTPIAQCAPAPPRFAPSPKPVARLRALKPYRGLSGTVGRTIEALRLSVNDAQRQILGAAIALGATPAGAGGLRSGAVRVTRAGGLSLRAYEYVPGVTVSGTLPARGAATLTIRGSAAARGTVTVSPTLQVSGRLGGRRVQTQFGTSAARAGLRPFGGLTLRQAVRRGQRIRGRG